MWEVGRINETWYGVAEAGKGTAVFTLSSAEEMKQGAYSMANFPVFRSFSD